MPQRSLWQVPGAAYYAAVTGAGVFGCWDGG
jgi:hypothetical protein